MARLNAQERRESREVEVDLGDGTTVLCERIDMPTLVFTGKIPLTMLSSVQAMLKGGAAVVNQETGEAHVDPELAMKILGEDRSQMLDVLREHAAAVAIDPKISITDTDDPNVVLARHLGFSELMAIWNETSFKGGVEKQTAARFRKKSPRAARHAAPPRRDVPSTTVVVDLGPGPDGKRREYTGM